MSVRSGRGKLTDMADDLLHDHLDLDGLDLPRELDSRESDGILVRLLWRSIADAITIAVTDARSGEHFEVAVEGRHALHAFHHPFAYAA